MIKVITALPNKPLLWQMDNSWLSSSSCSNVLFNAVEVEVSDFIPYTNMIFDGASTYRKWTIPEINNTYTFDTNDSTSFNGSSYVNFSQTIDFEDTATRYIYSDSEGENLIDEREFDVYTNVEVDIYTNLASFADKTADPNSKVYGAIRFYITCFRWLGEPDVSETESFCFVSRSYGTGTAMQPQFNFSSDMGEAMQVTGEYNEGEMISATGSVIPKFKRI